MEPLVDGHVAGVVHPLQQHRSGSAVVGKDEGSLGGGSDQRGGRPGGRSRPRQRHGKGWTGECGCGWGELDKRRLEFT